MIDIKAERKAIRRLLWRWGAVHKYCVRRQKELSEIGELIDAAMDIKPYELFGVDKKNLYGDTPRDVLPPQHVSTPSNPTERNAEMIMALKARYAQALMDITEDIQRELDFAAAMDSVMLDLSEDERSVLRYRYCHGMRQERIAKILVYSQSQVCKKMRRAENKLMGWIAVLAKEE